MTSIPATYPVPTYAAGREILQTLRERFRTGGGRHSIQPVAWYDTFDWRLYQDGGALSARPANQGWDLLWSSRDGTARHRIWVENLPAFAWDLPAGAFREALAQVIEMRRLLPQVRAEFIGETLHILEADNRVVARVDFEAGTAEAVEDTGSESRVSPRVQILPRDGSPEEYSRIVSFLEGEIGLRSEPCDPFDRALTAVGKRPGGYSSKIAVTLDPEMRADAAAKQIHLSLLQTMRSNEDGVRQGLDTEFLHDFRVAVRRTRTCLAQIKGVFPEARTTHFRDEFRWLGKVTGPTRDLDVYLLEMPAYEAFLPEDVRQGLAPLTRFLEKHQQIEQVRMVEELNSPRYHSLTQDWERFLQESRPHGHPLPVARRPILEVATERIARRWKRVLKLGTGIGKESPEEKFHRLRIECKKLRYLLEFFRSLYDPKTLENVVKRLKRLQDSLGSYNDLRQQRTSLVRFAREMYEEQSAAPETFLAMGRLQEHLLSLQESQGKSFRHEFSRFIGKKTRERMQQLLGKRRKAGPRT